MKKFTYAIFIVLLFIGCGDFLKPVSNTEYVPETAIALQEMLYGNAYPIALAHTSSSNKNTNVNAVLALLDPDLTYSSHLAKPSGLDDYIEFSRALYSYSPDLAEVSDRLTNYTTFYDVWKTVYFKVIGCNSALDYIDKVKGSQEEKNSVLAQAYTLRGFYFFHLVNLYAPAFTNKPEADGIILKLDSNLEPYGLPRSSVKETYEQILKDLHLAEKYYALMPKEEQFQPNFKTSLPMLQLLLSKVYLYMGRWSEAATYADKVIRDWSFSLLDLNALPEPPSKPNEKLTESPYLPFNTYSCSTENIWFWGPVSTYLKLLNNSTVGISTSGEGYKRGLFCASSDLLSSFVEGDLRKTRYIITERYSFSATTDCEYSAFAKVPVDAKKAAITIPDTYALAFRLSEAYLNRAEALAMLKRGSEVYPLLNELRKNRFALDKFKEMEALSDDALIDFVRQERRLELCLEGGNRFFDLRRWGIGFSRTYRYMGSETTFTLEPNDPCLTLQLPLEAMKYNLYIRQNPKGDKKLF